MEIHGGGRSTLRSVRRRDRYRAIRQAWSALGCWGAHLADDMETDFSHAAHRKNGAAAGRACSGRARCDRRAGSRSRSHSEPPRWPPRCLHHGSFNDMVVPDMTSLTPLTARGAVLALGLTVGISAAAF